MTTPTPPADPSRCYPVSVEFADCDPAGIVYFPNFFRWMDAASRHWFVVRGVPTWRECEARWGIIGTPIVDAHSKFMKPALYGEKLAIETEVAEWRRSSFVQRHRIWRGTDLLVEGEEVRVFAARGAGGVGIKAVPVPDGIRALA
jgi:4-hydroxybenzoyl-CoA thioesterase